MLTNILNQNKFVKSPNLPEKRISICMASTEYPSVISDLKSLSIEVIPVERCNDIQHGVSSHADMICHHVGDNNIFLYNYSENLKHTLESYGFNVTYADLKLNPTYPNDIAFNVARVGEKLICNTKYTCNKIIAGIDKSNIINTAQGYAKCSVLVIDNNSIITSDPNIYTVAQKNGIDVLHISCGFIRLDGYEYGFIGGCGSKIDFHTLFLTGDVNSHPDSERIIDFTKKKGVDIICGSSKTLIDIGSIIPLLY